jgi:hypothetical protein
VFPLYEAFLVAIDISYIERIDRVATDNAREEARKAGHLSDDEIKKIRRVEWVLTVGDPPLYSFKPFDVIHMRDERLTVQVRAATADQFNDKKIDGEIAFWLYRSVSLLGMYSSTQSEFVEFLKSGRCSRLGLDVELIL